ncbi:MAG: hypothetical protein HY235_07420 [Acidobacteria bacterium]|nr:hypothetical protein [Acidobacteriota bacterium]
MNLKWNKLLSNSFMVNSVAISDDASRVISGTYYYPYPGTPSDDVDGTYGTYCHDSSGTRIWAEEYDGDEGVYAVAISGDGRIAAAGGMLSGGQYSDNPDTGMLRAFDAANGTRLLDFTDFRRRVNSTALSADGSVLAAGVARKVYIFVAAGGLFPLAPAVVSAAGEVVSVAVHASGGWVAACDKRGKVYLATIAGGVVQTFQWAAATRTPFLSVAISRSSGYFVVGGGNDVLLFTLKSMMLGTGPVARFPVPAGGTRQDVRWVAISDDGALIAAVANAQQDGLVLALSNKNSQLSLAWQQQLDRNPNSTSMDSAAKFVTAADGLPYGTKGTFYLFNGVGSKNGEEPTSNMNWPMVISANGKAIAAGSDNGTLYYFVP